MSRTVDILLFSIIVGYVGSFLVPDGRVSVHSPVGEIVGFSGMLTIKGSQKFLHKFLGIPYAEAPIGTRRLRKPVPKAAFRTPFDASEYGAACYQLSVSRADIKQNVSYSEDCLFLNIFAPGHLHGSNHLYPVMIWIHGGGFVNGNSNFYDAGPLSLSGDVIVITINYRLNVYGFLSTNDPNSAGNFGLWDQHVAIKWVHDNIHAFGGDPNRVTLCGESAGGASVAYQTIYPGNQGLFQRAIPQSGSFSNSWAFTSPADSQNITEQFASYVNCSSMDSPSLVLCMQSKSAQEINDALNGPALKNGVTSWTPVIDGQFLFNDPNKLVAGKFPSQQVEDMFLGVDLIVGVNNKEGFVFYPNINESTELDYNKSYVHDILIPDMLRTYALKDESSLSSVKAATVLEYTDWQNLDNDTMQFGRYIDFVTDYFFHVPAAQTAQRHALSPSKQTYIYELSAAPPAHLLPVFSTLDGPTVANHADDLAFIFWPTFMDFRTGERRNSTIAGAQTKIANAMITMWTNFAKTGNPNKPTDVWQYINTTWPEYDLTSQKYININPDLGNNIVQERFANRAVEFWTKLIPSVEQAAKLAQLKVQGST